MDEEKLNKKRQSRLAPLPIHGAKSKFVSGYEASQHSKKPFTPWREEDIICEGCGQPRKFNEFKRNDDLCIYCMDETGGITR